MSTGETDVMEESEARQPSNGSKAPGDKMTAKQRTEERRQKEIDANQREWEAALAEFVIPGGQYTYDLMRLLPETWKDPSTGQTYMPGKNDGRGKFVASYSVHPSLSEIEAVHGGHKYLMQVKGPDKNDPDTIATKRIKLPEILSPPKTVGTPLGAMPFNHVPTVPPPKEDNSTLNALMDMMKEQIRDLRDQVKQKPAVDTDAQRRRDEEREERKQQHEKEMARIKAESDNRIEEARLRAQAEKDAREAAEKERARVADLAEKERQRQHEREMAEIKAAAEARKVDEAARREEERQRRDEEQKREDRRRAEDEKREERHQATLKEIRESNQKMFERMTKEDPEDRILKTVQLIETLRGGKDDKEESGPIVNAFAKLIPDVGKMADRIVTQMATQAGAPKEKKPPKTTTVAVDVDDSPSPPTEVVQEPSSDELPGLRWPSESDDLRAMALMFSDNLNTALNAKWGATTIFKKILLRFPQNFRDALKEIPFEAVMAAVIENAKEDAPIVSSKGKMMLKILHATLVAHEKDNKK